MTTISISPLANQSIPRETKHVQDKKQTTQALQIRESETELSELELNLHENTI